MIKSIVGYTGFVGSNLCAFGKFDNFYNSKNIEEAFDTKPDILYFAGIRAEKFLANSNPKKDLENIYNAIETIKKIDPKKLVLISTVDVYPVPNDVDEDSIIEGTGDAYGTNRYIFERMAKKDFPNTLIVRLPALFGINIKKNFIYDCLNPIPSMLNNNIYNRLTRINNNIKKYYEKFDDNFYKIIKLKDTQKEELLQILRDCDFDARYFTDSRSVYQFYPLKRLYDDIQIALDNGLKIINISSEPLSSSEIYRFLFNKEFVNEVSTKPAYYNFKSKYATLYGGSNGYIIKKKDVLNELRSFVNNYEK